MKCRRRVCIALSAWVIAILSLSLFICRDGQVCDIRKGSGSKHFDASSIWSNRVQALEITLNKDEPLNAYSTPASEPIQSKFKTPLTCFPRPTKSFELVILVTSSSTSLGSERRNSIRRTWHSKWHNVTHALPVWGTFFLLGQSNDTNVMQKLSDEANNHHDLIIGNFVDHFFNLSVKVMVGFEWVSRFATSTKFLLKLDDDVMPILPNVFAFLFDKGTPQSSLYAGSMQVLGIPLRTGKYVVTEEEFPGKHYPRYVSGGGIALSLDVAKAMVNAFNMSDYFKIDDVFFGMLALRLGLYPYHGINFRLNHPDNGPCTCIPDAVVQHGFGVPTCLETAYERTLFSLDRHMKKFEASRVWRGNWTAGE